MEMEIKEIANGNSFSILLNNLIVQKQPYNGETETVLERNNVNIKIERKSINGLTTISLSNIDELRRMGVIQNNPSFNPSFNYMIQPGYECASAEVGNSIALAYSGKEYVSLFQITKQNGRIVSFIINNLPNEDNFYYLLIFQ